MKIVFMGTPDFAVESLEAIHEAGHEVLLVVSQEDKAKGRKGIIEKTPVKKAAESLGIPVLSTRRLREDRDCIEHIRSLEPDCIVVTAFGQILPKEVLDIPKLAPINVHASLLPKYRGASPIQAAVLAGDAESGITTMLMAEGLDTGDILLQDRLSLEPGETAESLFLKLGRLSRISIIKTLEELEKGRIKAIPQKEEEASYTGIIKKKDGFINWNQEAEVIERKVRGYIPWPNAISILPNGKSFKICKAEVETEKTEDCISLGKIENGDIEEYLGDKMHLAYIPGEGRGEFYSSKDKKELFISTGKALLKVDELQVEGKNRMAAAEFLRGYVVGDGKQR